MFAWRISGSSRAAPARRPRRRHAGRGRAGLERASHAAAAPQVRVAACQQLPALARCLGEEGLRRSLVEVLAQLLEDEEVQVGA